MTPQSLKRLDYYQRIYRDASTTNFELNARLKTILQPVTDSGKKLGRPILWGSETHEFLMKNIPQLFPRPDDYQPKRRKERVVDVTRNFYKSDWIDLGFRSRKEGQIFIKRFRQRGEDLSNLDKVRAIVEQYRDDFRLNEPELLAQAHEGFQSTFKVTHRGHTPHYTTYLDDLAAMIENLIQLHTHGEVRAVHIQVNAQVLMRTMEGDNEVRTWLPGTTELILPGASVVTSLDSLMSQVDGFTREKSGMVFEDFLGTYINITDAELVTGSSYIPLPEELAGPQKKLINPKNEGDHLCFLYAIIALLHYDEIGRDHQRVSKLRRFLPRYSFDESDFPMVADKRKISKYEEIFRCNINLLMHTEGEGSLAKRISPLFASRNSFDREVNLLLIGSEGGCHYVGIRELSALLSSAGSSPKDKHYYCLKCLHATTSASDHETHKQDCGSNLQKVSMPDSLRRKKGETDWEFAERLRKTQQKCKFHFKGFSKTLPIPVVIYADQEAFQLTSDDPKCKALPQMVNSCAYVAIDYYEKKIVEDFIAYGDTCVREMLDSIKRLSEKIFEKYFHEAKPMKIRPRDQIKFQKLQGAYDAKQGEILKCMGCCSLCGKHFTPSGSKPVRHHNHFTGEFLGIAHDSCNLKARSPTLIDVVHHNFKGYDSHAIIRELNRDDYEKVDIVPDNEEKWKSFTLTFEHPEKRIKVAKEKPPGRIARHGVVVLESGEEVDNPKLFYEHVHYIKEAKEVNRHNKLCVRKIRFIDSLAFLSTSLDNVTKSMSDSEFRYTRKFAGENFELLRKKGVYPYEYMDGPARFEETMLPPLSAFVSRLSHGTSDIKKLSQEDLNELKKGYVHAEHVWKHFRMKTMREYHELYLKTDIHILADAFESFRELSMRSFGLDPAHYITLPSMGLDACLKLTKANLELMTDQSMYLFCEEAKIGGVSSVFSKRFARAHNSYLDPNHDNSSPDTSYIKYIDMNSLYAFSMTQNLPVGGFKWLGDVSDFNLLHSNCDGDTGYFVEVDTHLPRCVTLCESYRLWKDGKAIDCGLKDFYQTFEEHDHHDRCACLHDRQSDYPAFPEMITPTKGMLSPLQQGGKDCAVPKLIPNLMDKTRYKVHLKVLQYWMRCGWEVTKVHRILRFRQNPWMKPYIEHCIGMRKVAKTEFEKDFWKLLCNAVFGKTMEDVRRHSRVVLLSATEEEAKFKRLTKHNAIRKGPLPQHIHGDMYSINVVKTRVTLNKPIYVGVSILGLSKLFMHEFWYGVLKPMYGSKLHLLYSDTDSFIYQVYTEDHYKDLALIKDKFDFSNFPKDHPLYDETNKKVGGMMKSETAHIPIYEFCGIRSKMNSIKTLTPFSKDGKMVDKVCTGKGIWKKILNDLRHEDYKRCIFHEEKPENMVQRARMYNLQSKNHVVHLTQTDKITLSTHDDKRYLLKDGVTQLPFGHYKLF